MNPGFKGEIMALDIATKTGFAIGPVERPNRFGSFRCAPDGSSSGAVFAGFMKWMAEQLSAFKPRVIIFEAPMPPSQMAGKTTADVARRLLGLPAIAEAVAYHFGVYDVREASVGDVRHYFLGRRNIKSAEAKAATIKKCRVLGYSPEDDNAADAIALHRFIAGSLVPELRIETSPLFAPGRMKVMA
jgi:hypothetical protein